MDGRRATVLVLLAGMVLGGTAATAGDTTMAGGAACPAVCACQAGTGGRVDADCASRNLSEIPEGFSPNTTTLDLSMNSLSELQPYAFSHLKNLQEIRLMGNQMKTLPAHVFGGLRKLTSLHLQQNLFTQVPSAALKGLYRLEQLQLDACNIRVVADDSFETLTNLTMLWLDHNNLTTIPVAALSKLTNLAALTLALNSIQVVPNYAFVNLTRLAVLLLNYNNISSIGDYAFEGLSDLKMLELNGNRLKHVPVGLASLPRLTELNLAENDIHYLPDDCFRGNKELTVLQLKKNPIHSAGRFAFSNLPKLDRLILSEARDQVEFPDLSGTNNLVTLTLDRGNIKFIPTDICSKLHKLQSFDIHSNSITIIPDMSGCHDLRTLNLGNNELMSLSGRPFQGLSQLRDLTLSHNMIQDVPASAFTNLTQLQYLDLQHNRIETIHPDAFVPLQNLEDLNVGDNQFAALPTRGLSKLKNLKTFGNKRLKDFPLPETFPRIQRLTLSYAYHCCQFIQEKPKDHDKGEVKLKEDITWLSKDPDNIFLRNLTNIWGPLENISDNYHSLVEDIWDSFGTDEAMDYPEDIPKSAANYFKNYGPRLDAQDIIIARPPILCKPMPGPFMPCDDLMGWWSLRCGVWIVFLLALLGNGTVLLVSMVSRTKMDVPRFLICNLAFADFFMGIYLGFLAIVDASTLGEFKKHAIQWQTSLGCQMAGFLGVLSSELSVFTLTLITMERFYAITHAMHLNKRLSLRHAGYIMACGWFLAGMLAAMPLFGVSDYRKFAICLPFEISDNVSLGYVCFIMFLNCLAFGVIVSCYTKMYCSIRGSQAWNSNDSRVAKRMALLVFTDFACWAPISFFSLTAAFGLELISLNDAKVFTIFVLPLNSCANPFLYAIFTKQFKKDCTQICKRLEESAMSRSLSRFSNRNLSISWGSSRRPSLLNSFFNIDKRMSRSNSISGASAAQLEAAGLNSSTRATNGSSGRTLPDRPLPEPLPMANGSSSNPIRQVHHKSTCCFSNSSGEAVLMNGSGPLRCTCHRSNGILRSAMREGPVGAGSALLSLIRHKHGSDKMGDGADSDQEEGPWLGQDAPGAHRDTLGLFPLLPLGESPGGARRPLESSQRSIHMGSHSPRAPLHGKSKSPSPSGIKKMTLNCCNGSPRESMRSPGPEYQLMRPREESSFETDGLPTTGNDPSSSDLDHSSSLAMMNNNHEYVNITEDMINELQRIRNSSTSPPEDSSASDSVYAVKSQPPSPQASGRTTVAAIEAVRETPTMAAPELPCPRTSGIPSGERQDPEGSETKEKPSMKRFQALSSLPWRGCHCNQPHCKGKRVAAARRQLALGRSASVDGTQLGAISGPGCNLSRQLWLSSTEHDFPALEPTCTGGSTSSLPMQCKKKEVLRKSNSFDYDDTMLKRPLDSERAVRSLPGLSDLGSADKDMSNGAHNTTDSVSQRTCSLPACTHSSPHPPPRLQPLSRNSSPRHPSPSQAASRCAHPTDSLFNPHPPRPITPTHSNCTEGKTPTDSAHGTHSPSPHKRYTDRHLTDAPTTDSSHSSCSPQPTAPQSPIPNTVKHNTTLGPHHSSHIYRTDNYRPQTPPARLPNGQPADTGAPPLKERSASDPEHLSKLSSDQLTDPQQQLQHQQYQSKVNTRVVLSASVPQVILQDTCREGASSTTASEISI